MSGQKPTRMPPIAVVGMAAWYPGAADLGEFWRNVLARRRAFRQFPENRLGQDYRSDDPMAPDRTYVQRGAFIDGFAFDWVGHRIPKRMYDGADIAHWLAFDVALRAFADGGYDRDSLPREGTGVVVGNTLTGEVSRAKGLRLRWPFVVRAVREGAGALGYSRSAADQLLAVTEDVYKSVFPEVTEDTLPGMLSNTIAGQVCNLLDLRGGAYTVDGACASSLIAIGQGCDALVDGRMDLVLAGGVDISIDPFELVGFSKIGALAKEEMYVYERRSQGFYPGEGCGWVLLKRLADAERDGDYVYATLRGWGMSSDGRGGLTAPGVDGQSLAVGRAYERAGYRLSDVDFVEGHGTGTAVGDRTELTALARVLEDEGATRPVGMTALKAMVGHCKAAAGVGSFIKAALAVNQRVLPPLAGCDRRHEVFDDASLYPLIEGEERDPTGRVRAGVSAFGFGGINVHITVESAGPPKDGLRPGLDHRAAFASPQDSELVCFRAASAEAMVAQVKPLADVAEAISYAEVADLAAHCAQTLGTGTLRAALVATGPDDLAHKLRTLLHMLEAPPADGEVRVDASDELWLSSGRVECRVGFLFPGQASQRLGMGGRLVERHEWAREIVAEADLATGGYGDRVVSDFVYRPVHKTTASELRAWSDELVATEVTQPAVSLASVLHTVHLRRLGIEPAVVAGHSLGELGALWAAGALSMPQLFALARERGERMAHDDDDEPGSMVGLRCGLQAAEELCAPTSGQVVVANRNSDHQTVVSGTREAVDAVVAAASERGIGSRRLPVANAFHSHMVAGAADHLADYEGVPELLGPLTAKLRSCVDGSELEPGMGLRAHVARQLLERVDFAALSTAMADEVDVLLEVGPGQVLSGLVADTASASHTPCFPVEGEPGRTRSLHRALAAAYAYGADVRIEELFADRLLCPWVPPTERVFIENPCELPFATPQIPESFDRSPKGEPASLLPEDAGIDAGVLADYLSARGGFLADVIRADLSATPLVAAGRGNVASPAGSGVVVGVGANGSDAKARFSAEPSVADRAVADDATAGARAGRPDPEDVLIDLIVERTGFPRDSIRPDMQLLNDLNLESIAATEILAKAFAQSAAGEPTDRSGLFEASIAEIADAIRATFADDAEAGAAVPLGPSVGPADASGLLDVLEGLSSAPTWVRDFEILLTEEPLGSPPRQRATALAGKTIRVASDDRDDAATALADAVGAIGGETVETMAFSELAATPAGASDVVVAILPSPVEGAETGADTRRMVDALLAVQATASAEGLVVLVQFGGGWFGTRPDVASWPLSCGAFAATLHHERPHLRVRVVDVMPDVDLDTLAACVLDEAASEDAFARAGYDAERVRRVPRPRLVPGMRHSRRATLGQDDVLFVPGGGKGITAELAFVAALESGCRVVVAGRSSPDDDEAVAATLARFADAGAECRWVRCDVTDADSVADAVAQASSVGPITAVLFGAGINRFGRLGTESADAAAQVVDVKTTGFRLVLDALADQPPRIVFALSSIIGVTGMPGNAWYALGNEALDRILVGYRDAHPDTEVCSLAYSLWDDTGMAALDGVTEGLRRMGTSAIPVDQATAHFVDLLV